MVDSAHTQDSQYLCMGWHTVYWNKLFLLKTNCFCFRPTTISVDLEVNAQQINMRR